MSERRTERTERGQQPFDHVALLTAVQALSNGECLPPNGASEYRAFYGLTFQELCDNHQLCVVEAAGERIAVQYYFPAQIVGHVFFLHGYFDHVGLFTHVIEALLRRNLAVICFDQIGHGLSSGEPSSIESFDRYVDVTRAVYDFARGDLAVDPSTAWHWIGQSMGGAIVLETLQQTTPPEGVAELVVFAPLTRPFAWPINRWVLRLARIFVTSRPRHITNNAENAEFLALQHVDPLRATLLQVAWVEAMKAWHLRFASAPESSLAPKVIQGDADKTVDRHHMRRVFARRYPNAIHFLIKAGRHHLGNESQAKRDAMWKWLDENCRWSSTGE